MADLYFSRDTKLYMVQKEAAGVDSNVWVLPVMDGFSFSQATNTSEIALNEMSDALGNSRRGRKVFNDSLAPAEWSFSMYARPFLATKAASPAVPSTPGDGGWGDSHVHSCEEALWANFVAINSWDTTNDAWTVTTNSVVNTATEATYGFGNSNKTTLGTFDLYFILGGCSSTTNQGYKIENCVVNSTGIDFDIDGITTLNFSGFGGEITDVEATFDPATLTGTAGVYIDEGIPSTDNFIRNRLTTLSVESADHTTFPGTGSGVYDEIAVTGGSISLENNISFLTPETLCSVSSPIGHVTGTRTIGGSFTAYLSVSGTGGSSADLFKDLTSAEAKTTITNSFNLAFAIGGSTTTPSVTVNLPQCHIDIPTHSIEDVIAVETTFSALSTDMDTADEATVVYKAP